MSATRRDLAHFGEEVSVLNYSNEEARDTDTSRKYRGRSLEETNINKTSTNSNSMAPNNNNNYHPAHPSHSSYPSHLSPSATFHHAFQHGTYTRTIFLLALCLFFLWATSYFCRDHILVLSPRFRDEEGVSIQDFGTMMSAGYIAYGGGKVVFGVFGERWGGQTSLAIAIFGTVACTFVFVANSGRGFQFDDGSSSHAVVRGAEGDGAGSSSSSSSSSSGSDNSSVRNINKHSNTDTSYSNGSTEPFSWISLYMVLRFLQSAGWVGMVSLASRTVLKIYHGRFMSFLTLSFLVGDSSVRYFQSKLLLVKGGLLVRTGMPRTDNVSSLSNGNSGKAVGMIGDGRNTAVAVHTASNNTGASVDGAPSWREIFVISGCLTFVFGIVFLCLIRTTVRKVQTLLRDGGLINERNELQENGQNEPSQQKLNLDGMSMNQNQNRQTPPHQNLPPQQVLSQRAEKFSEKEPPPASLRSIVLPLLKSRKFYIACALSFQIDMIRETFNVFSVPFLLSLPSVSQSDAARASAVFSLLGIPSSLLGGMLVDYFTKRGKIEAAVENQSLNNLKSRRDSTSILSPGSVDSTRSNASERENLNAAVESASLSRPQTPGDTDQDVNVALSNNLSTNNRSVPSMTSSTRIILSQSLPSSKALASSESPRRLVFSLWLIPTLIGLIGLAFFVVDAAGKEAGMQQQQQRGLSSSTSTNTTSSYISATICLAMCGFGIGGAYSIKIGVISLDLGGSKRSGAACGLVDAAGYLGAVIIMSLFSNDKNAAKTASGDQQREAFARLFRMNVVTCCTLIATGLLYYKYGDKEVEEEGSGSNLNRNGTGGTGVGSAGGSRGTASAGKGIDGEIELEEATEMGVGASGRQERWRRIGSAGPEPIGKRNYAEGVEKSSQKSRAGCVRDGRQSTNTLVNLVCFVQAQVL